MTERIDHAAEARMHIEWAHDQQARTGECDETVQHNATLAVAEATLALVDQQATANFIAYATLLEMQYAEAANHETEFDWDTRAESNQRHGLALARIREGLGIA